MCCRLWRNILADKPRVTRFPVEFDSVAAAPETGDMGEDTNPGMEGSAMTLEDNTAAPQSFAPQGFSIPSSMPSPGMGGDMDMS